MTQLHSNGDSRIDPELLVGMFDGLSTDDTSSGVDTTPAGIPDAVKLGRTVGRIVGRSFGGAMGAEIGAILAPLFAGIDDIEAVYSGTGDTRETKHPYDRKRRSGENDPAGDRDSESDAGARTGDDTPADGREMTREDESNEAPTKRGDGSRLVDDEFRKDDDPAADEDDDRDAWGRREVGIDWPLPPESRLPMDC